MLILFRSTDGFIPCWPSASQVTQPRSILAENKEPTLIRGEQVVDICIVGGGVSGLAASLSSSNAITNGSAPTVVLLESTPTFGGRVQTDITNDAKMFDRGFAVFIEQYPLARRLLDYDALELFPFAPGALIKLDDREELARIADPIRQPSALFGSIVSPIGTLWDKAKVARLVLHVRLNSIESLLAEDETDTYSALKDRWGFSEQMISSFFRPFFQGIFLCPLPEQSSRLFHFVFKMFSEGSASLPKNGIGAVSMQLKEQCTAELRANQPVRSISILNNGMFLVESSAEYIKARSVIIATDGPASKSLLSNVEGLEDLKSDHEQPQRMVGCLYYSFQGRPPVQDPVLILNGESRSRDNHAPINNICFPTVVKKRSVGGQDAAHICSVAVLEDALQIYNDDDGLDKAVRRQLSNWFPAHGVSEWKLERVYRIRNAQPAQLGGPQPANQLRSNAEYRGRKLPPGLFVCGDNVSTASLNGALESGYNAGSAAAAYVADR